MSGVGVDTNDGENKDEDGESLPGDRMRVPSTWPGSTDGETEREVIEMNRKENGEGYRGEIEMIMISYAGYRCS